MKIANKKYLSNVLASKKIAVASGVLLVGMVLSYSSLALASPMSLWLKSTGPQKVDQSVALSVAPSIGDINTSKISTSPTIEGKWTYQKGFFGKESRLEISPTKPMKANTKYKIYFGEVNGLFGQQVNVSAIEFTTEKAPSLQNSGLNSSTDGKVIGADEELVVSLTRPNRGLRQLTLRTIPAVELELSVEGDSKFTWKPKSLLPQGESLQVEVRDEKNDETLLRKNLLVAKEPAVSSLVKSTYFDDKDIARIEFAVDIDTKTSSNSVVFDLAGTGKWTSPRIYEFRPTTVEPKTEYHYVIKKGLRSIEGGLVTEDKSYAFSTVGSVSPSIPAIGKEVAQAQQVIKITFDQQVDRKSAEERVSVSAGQVVKFDWLDNTLSLTVREIGFQKNVVVTIGAGVKNVGFGLPSDKIVTMNFSTEARIRRLDVPMYRQQRSSTCVPASLRMALAYYGVSVDEMTLVYSMGYNPRPMNRDTNPYTWDDPELMYVGDVDGKGIYESAGVDAGPTVKAVRSQGRSALAIRGASAEWIASQIYEGHPVVMFGATRDNDFVTWQTPTGGVAKMNKSSHATVVTGVKGEANAPIGFWVNDPLSGTSFWSAEKVRANIARDAYRQAVVVY